MLRSDIPEVLFSSIKEDDPYRTSKVFQIERWCYANWDLHKECGKKRHDFIAQVLSSEDCWKKADSLHEVKLDRQIVSKKLIVPDSDNPFGTKRYKIACRCCLEEDIISLFEERKKRLSAQGKSRLLEYDYLVKCLGRDRLVQFWSHFVSGYIYKLNLNGLHPHEYGLKCAIDLKQAEAVEFFWNKIKSLPVDELSAQKKDEIFIKTAVRAAGNYCNSYPEIFEFCFSQISPDKYSELLKRDLAENRYYGSLNTLQSALRFDQFQRLFDCLEPSDVSRGKYCDWLRHVEIRKCSGRHLDSGVKLFMHMWVKEGFGSHRASALNVIMMSNSVFQGELLISFLSKGCMLPIWAILDKAGPDQIKEFVGSRQADHILSVLKERGDQDSLNKFLSYSKSIVKELENPSASLSEVNLSRTHEAKRPKIK